MRLAWCAILLLVPQDEEVERLVNQLADDDIAVRERASERLVEIGEPARGALRKAAGGSDPEVASRARSILGEIELAENRKKFFGPAWRVDLPDEERPLSRIADLLHEQTGVTLKIPAEAAEARVRIGAKGLLLWEFLDRLCATHGGLRIALDQPKDAVALEIGKPSGAPVRYSGPFRVSIERLKIERRNPFGAKWERGTMVLDLAWQPNVRPVHEFYAEPDVRIDEIKGDDGKALQVDPKMETLMGGFQYGHQHPRLYRHFAAFERPDAKVRRLAVLRGSAEMLFPLRFETLRFDKPATLKVGGYSITLKKWEAKKEGLAATLSVEVEENERSGRDARVEIRARVWEVRLIDDRGKEHAGSWGSSAHASGGGTESWAAEITFPDVAAPAAIRVVWLADYFEKRIEFEFRDVELP